MIHTICPNLTTLLMAAEPPGGRHRMRATSADVFRNGLIILLSDSRDTIASIAKRLGCGTDTVNRVRRLYRQGGIQALYPIKPPGPPGVGGGKGTPSTGCGACPAGAAFSPCIRSTRRAVPPEPLLRSCAR